MRFTKIVIFVILSLAVGFLGCSKDQKSEAPKQEQITKNLVPAKVEIKGNAFELELTDLKVLMTVNTTSNKTKDVLDIQGVTLEYFNEAGNKIPFSSGEKIVKVYSFWTALQPGESAEGSLDVTIPKIAVKEKTLGKIEVNLVYVPSPLKRETLTLPEKVE
jgi:hypothetical protein